MTVIRDVVYLLSAGLDGSGGCRARSHFTLLRLCSKLQKKMRVNPGF